MLPHLFERISSFPFRLPKGTKGDDLTLDATLDVAGAASIAGGLVVGGDTDNLTIAPDGTLTLNGAATVWKDMVISLTAARVGATAAPTLEKIADNGAGSDGLFANHYSPTIIQQTHFDREVEHDYREGSDLYPHVHWMATTTNAGVVVLGLEYAWVNINGVLGDSTVITVAVDAPEVAYKDLLTPFAEVLDGTGMLRSSTIFGRFFRDATNEADTYPDKIVGIDMDFHYQIDRLGEANLPGS